MKLAFIEGTNPCLPGEGALCPLYVQPVLPMGMTPGLPSWVQTGFSADAELPGNLAKLSYTFVCHTVCTSSTTQHPSIPIRWLYSKAASQNLKKAATFLQERTERRITTVHWESYPWDRPEYTLSSWNLRFKLIEPSVLGPDPSLSYLYSQPGWVVL